MTSTTARWWRRFYLPVKELKVRIAERPLAIKGVDSTRCPSRLNVMSNNSFHTGTFAHRKIVSLVNSKGDVKRLHSGKMINFLTVISVKGTKYRDIQRQNMC